MDKTEFLEKLLDSLEYEVVKEKGGQYYITKEGKAVPGSYGDKKKVIKHCHLFWASFYVRAFKQSLFCFVEFLP